ncbi:MAG: single-stranded-DNA-specific exonuclease RecJ [Beijerinckiaceae bacterium]
MNLKPRLFLNVSNSATGRPWHDRLDLKGQARAQAINQQIGLPDILARILAGRNVGPDEAEAYLDPAIRKLMPDPSTLADMDAAANRIAAAIEAGDKVAIFGDYDVDGACSSALMGEFLRHCGVPFAIHIPDRIFEGYGPNAEAIASLAQQGARLLVTVDCGTASFEPFAEAERLGLDVVVLDHHQTGETLPQVAALVNPNRQDDLSELGHLCAAGVVFMTLTAVTRELRRRGYWTAQRPAPDLLAMLDLVALATVADVVPLKGLNRAFVVKGLAVMQMRARPGMRALFDVARASGPPRAFMLGFLIGPRINAGGRIGDAALGARLLLEQDDAEALRIAQELDRLNSERQTIEAATLAEAEAEVIASLGAKGDTTLIIAAGEGWHPGVAGLIASRLKERFRRPAFAIAFAGATGTGSGRSIAGVDLGRAVRRAVDEGHLVKGGGHAMAAGLTIERQKLGAFRAFMDSELARETGDARARNALEVDAALTAGGLRPELVEEMEKAGPFGAGNPEPVIALPAHRIADAGVVGSDHVRVRIAAGDRGHIDAIAFRCATAELGQALLAARGRTMHIAGSLSIDRWGGRPRVQLRIADIAEPKEPD